RQLEKDAAEEGVAGGAIAGAMVCPKSQMAPLNPRANRRHTGVRTARLRSPQRWTKANVAGIALRRASPLSPAWSALSLACAVVLGDPGPSWGLPLLETQSGRRLSCAPASLDNADKAPAGPGVFVLTDDEMTSYYYVEACDTLRVAIGQLARGGGGRRGN